MRRDEAVFYVPGYCGVYRFLCTVAKSGTKFLKYLLPIVCRDSRKGCPYKLQKTRITAKFAG